MSAQSPIESPTILVVDDEPAIQRLIADILRLDGYTVLESRHAFHALQLCQQHPEPIHLLLTDVAMPYLNGRELASRALVLRPRMCVLYVSGYDDSLLTGFRFNEEVAFLQKPVGPDELLQKVRDVLRS